MWRIITSFAALAAALLVGTAIAQNPGSGPNVGALGFYGSPFYSANGHWQFGGATVPPVVSTCGTGAGDVSGTDAAFHFVTGSSASGVCTITPAVPYSKRPTCLVDTASATKPSYTISTTGVLVLGTVQDSTRYHVVCFAQPGGL